MYGFHITNAVGILIGAAALIFSAVVKDPARDK